MVRTTPGATTAQTPHVPPVAPQQQLQQLLDDFRAKANVPGAVIAVRHNGTTDVAASGFANTATGEAMTGAHRLRAASISKSFVAATVMQLVEEGKVRLDDTLAKWNPNFPSAGDVTVRQLLSHTSGVPDYTQSAAFSEALRRTPTVPWTHTQPIEVAAKMKRELQPGEKFQYSNTNYHLLGTIVEQVTGKSLLENVQSRLLDKLGMNTVLLDDGSAEVHADAHAYQKMQSGKQKDVTATLFGKNSAYRTTGWADGAVVATAPDLAQWMDELQTGQRAISQSSSRIMQQGTAAPPDGNGLGLFGFAPEQNGTFTGIGHTGGDPGFTSIAVRYPNLGATVALMMNGEPDTDFAQFAFEAAKALAGPGDAKDGAKALPKVPARV